MSGIGAIVWKDSRGEVDAGQVNLLARGLRAYGRDRQDSTHSGACALVYAHCARSTPHDPNAAPVKGGDGRFSLVFDGRLDNRDELSAELDLSDTADRSDARLAMACWERWQQKTPEKWTGPFACMVWDSQNNTLHAMCDQLGKRTLFWHETPDRFVIASAPKALFALPDVPCEPDMQKIADQMLQMFHDAERSYYKNIKRLQPASRLDMSPSGIRQTKYWDLSNVADVSYRSDAELTEQGRELLSKAVGRCLRGVRKPATFLSGGLDSSSVAVTALDHLPADTPLTSYTWVPSESWDGRCPPGYYGDEEPFVRAICDMHPRLKPEFVRSEGIGMFHLLDDFIDLAGCAPRNALNFCWLHDIQERAVEAGHDVILEGTMGNATLSWDGYGAFLEWLKKGQILRFCTELFGAGFTLRQMAWLFYNQVMLPVLPRNAVKFMRRAREGFPSWPYWYQLSAMNPDAFDKLNMSQRMQHYGWDFYSSGPFGKQARLELIASATMLEAASIYQGFKALHRIDIRDPMADLRLVEWCFGLPDASFRYNRRGRGLARRIMKDRLPDLVLNNRESGRQIIDWHVRMSADLDRVADEIDAMADDPDTAQLVDIERLRQLLKDWPDKDPLGRPRPDTTTAYPIVALPSVIAAGKLVRRAKGGNR